MDTDAFPDPNLPRHFARPFWPLGSNTRLADADIDRRLREQIHQYLSLLGEPYVAQLRCYPVTIPSPLTGWQAYPAYPSIICLEVGIPEFQQNVVPQDIYGHLAFICSSRLAASSSSSSSPSSPPPKLPIRFFRRLKSSSQEEPYAGMLHSTI